MYITTPIYYANNKPHIGHAYTTIIADIFARFSRLNKLPTFFLTGTDEHGEKIQKIAQNKGLEPKKFVDEIAATFQLSWDILDISYDNFIRTTFPEHEKAVQFVLNELYQKKFIYKGEYQGLYCVGCEQYKTKTDLIDGKCPDHKIEPELRTEKAYLFALSRFSKILFQKIESDELQIVPEARKNEILSFLEREELKDVAISRSKEEVSWGIELPFDPTQTTYVWIDAFLNYLTGLGWPWKKDLFEKFWPADIQVMGKDILRVHATIWPALLLALDLPLPKKFLINGFFTSGGTKMSKTLGNVLDPVAIAEKYGNDTLRYYLIKSIAIGEDGDISLEKIQEKHNNELVNGLGNLVARVLAMAEKYLKGKVPQPVFPTETISAINNAYLAYEKFFSEMRLDQALNTATKLISDLDRLIDQEAPWVLAKNDPLRLSEVLYILLESLRHIGRMLWPFLPQTSEKIFQKLGVFEEEMKNGWAERKEWGLLHEGTLVAKGDNLFTRFSS